MPVALQVYNVRTRRKEPFVPLRPSGPIGLYVCGLTVYDHAHIGHARTYVSFEAIRRWLEHRYPAPTFGVRHVQNVTDVDDKIIARAKERGVSPRAHAAEWDARCRASMERAGVRVPSGVDYPHVSTSIGDILRFIQVIVARGNAYVTKLGNVYFDVPGYDAKAQTEKALHDAEGRACGYGSLSNRDYREMTAGTRKDVESDKRHPADFALWKAADPEDHPDASWEPYAEAPELAAAVGGGASAVGKGGHATTLHATTLPGLVRGRPGWHIECSLMATRALGDQFDLHGGGQDLIFPHHENEIAQSQAKTGKAPFVTTWLHTGFLNVEGEKMSKSLGNFITLDQTLEELDAKHGPGRGAEVLRLYFLQTHYRSKIDFTRKGLEEAGLALERMERTRDSLEERAEMGKSGGAPGPAAPGGVGSGTNGDGAIIPEGAEGDAVLGSAAALLGKDFAAALDDDFHTPSALATLFAFQRDANRAIELGVTTRQARAALDTYVWCAGQLTLFSRPKKGADTHEAAVPAKLAEAAHGLSITVAAGATTASVMQQLLDARLAARQAKDWKRSDAIRDAAKAAGFLVEDTPQGQRWRPA